MVDQDKSKQELIDELAEMRRRLAALETADTPAAMTGMVEDIAERKRAKERLRESQARLRRFYESGLLGVIYWTMNGQVIDANDKFLEMVGYERADLAANRIDWINMTPPEYRPLDDRSVEELQGHRRQQGALREEYLRKDGTRVPIVVAGAMLDEARFHGVAFVLDITERKQAEEALQKAHDELEQRVKERTAELATANEKLDIFRRFIDASGVGFGMADLDGTIAYANPMLCRLMGEEKLDDVIGRNISAYYPEDYMQSRRDEMLPTLLREEYWHTETKVLRRHGKPVSIQQTSFLIRDEKGSPFRTGVVISDITEWKQAQEALAESEAKYRHLVETTDTGYLILDEAGRVLDANAEYVRLTGQRSLAEIIGKSVEEWTAPHDSERNVREVRQCLQSGKVRQLEIDYIGPNGKIIPIEINASVIATEKGRQIISLCRDISQRKQAEEEARRNRDLLQAIIDNTPALIYVKDLEGRVTVANRALCEAVGMDTQDVLGKSSRDVAADPQEAASHMANDRQVSETGRAIMFEESSFGRIFLSVKFPLTDAQGRVFAIGGVSTDITQRKRSQDALAKEHRNLKHLLQSSDHERQLIAYEIHDGLAQQLAGAIMQIQAFAHLKDKNPKEAAKAYDAGLTMLRQGHFEARRLIAGVRPPILDESGVVEAVAHLVNELRREKGPKIEFLNSVEFDRLDPTLENAIYRIAQEGLTNACQHSKSERIWVSLLQREDRLRIEIRDWGAGFDPGTVPKSHFGLEGIRQRARLLGGQCRIRSAAGKGSRITVTLHVVSRDVEE